MGRGLERLRESVSPWLVAASIGAVTLLTRLPFAGRYLFNWDAIQFAMGVQRFDLAAHRPHPPGYVGYVMLARLLVAVTGASTDTVLVALSMIAEVVTVVGLYLVARRALGEFAGIAAALLLLTSPLFWLYGETALTYGLEPGLALMAFALVARAVRRGDGLGWAAAVIAAAGAIRPTTELFLLPMLGVGMLLLWSRTRSRRSMATAVLVLAGATSAWLVPLMMLSGGPFAYMEQSALLARRVSGGSAVWSAGPGGLALNSNAVLMGLGFSLGLLLPLALAVAAFALLPVVDASAANRDWRHRGETAALVMAWVVPALTVFVLVHIGQLAYVLIAVPAVALLAGPVLEQVAAVAAGKRLQMRRPLRAALLAGCVAVNVALFFSPRDSLSQQVRDRDRHVSAMLAEIRGHQTGRT
ncbi:MAG: glycosyltransferase family 39 protein, partial [Candidatus Dormibacteraeota bacterium]|nr:glycosyltransferase family 39 protein [Candidatus Dormibacteraeota bacterium]